MTETSKTHAVPHAKRPFFAHAMRVLAVPIILGWILFAVVVSTIAPSLEVVGETHSSPMAPKDAPSLKAMMLMGHNFKEFDSNSTVMIVVEGQQPLGPDAHRYYDSIISKLKQDPQHIQHIQDFWGDRPSCAWRRAYPGGTMPVDLWSTSGPKLPRETWKSTSAALVRRYQRAFAKAANMLPVQRLGDVDARRDRFLTELGNRVDELHGQLLRAMRDRAASGDSCELARLCEVTIELQDVRSSHRQAVNEERLYMLASGHEVSTRLSPSLGVRVLLERAATTMCDLPGLERFMVFRREGGVLRAAATVFADHDEWARDCQAFSAGTRYDLVPKRPEALIIRRRSPAIVTDALNDPDAFQPIVQKMQTATMSVHRCLLMARS